MFILAIILWVIMIIAGIIAIFAGPSDKDSDDFPLRAGMVTTAVITGLLGFVFFTWSGIHSVPPKSIGVPVALGQVESGYYTPGAHWTWDPFLHLAIINETVQTTTFENGAPNPLPGTKQCNGALPVRIGGQQQACAKITIQWQVRKDAAGGLFSDYANQGDLMTVIENAVVIRELELVVNQQVGDYDPITDYQSVVGVNSQSSQFTSFGPAILKTMQEDIGDRITVKSVLFPYMGYSQQVENKLQGIQQAYANYAIARENILVNQANAQAFAKLGNPTVPQLIAQCLSDSKENRTSPMGCFPGQASGLQISK